MFSPYYAFARARGRGDPENHVAMNVALYGRPSRWAMTERGRGSLFRDADRLVIGASAMHWQGDALVVTIDEPRVPLPGRLRGQVIVRPRDTTTAAFDLDGAGRHRWRPIAPLCDITAAFVDPDIHWTGTGYFDSNDGDEPLEAAFRTWTWSRFDAGEGARIFYDVVLAGGTTRTLSLLAADGQIENAPPKSYRTLASTGWRMSRDAPCDAGTQPKLLSTLEDAPFYARSAVRCEIDGVARNGVHESLSLRRMASPVVRAMLPFKMFRRTAATHGGVGR